MQSHFLRTHRLVMLALVAFFGTFGAWAFLAKLDIVVIAQGKLVPTTFVQVAQPTEDGIVRRVLVKDGDRVEAGQPLVEMDAVYALEDSAAADAEVVSLEHRLQRINAELEGRTPVIKDVAVMAEYVSRHDAQASLIAEAQRQRESAAAELETARERLRKYQELAPITTRQADMLARLKASGFVSEAAHNDKLLARIETDREVDVQARAVKTAEAVLRQADAALNKIHTDYRRQLNIERTEVLLQLSQAEAQRNKQTHRASLQVLRAPVAGSVTGLAVFTAGQVVTAGSPLLSLVPEGDPLRFEGWLRNEDSAFVFPGMPGKVKLAAYPFQKYGWLEGELTWLGVDAETPESMRNAQGEPLFYRVRTSLPAQSLNVEGNLLELKPGMQATADLHVGTRTLFEYLTSPLRKIALEAARER